MYKFWRFPAYFELQSLKWILYIPNILYIAHSGGVTISCSLRAEFWKFFLLPNLSPDDIRLLLRILLELGCCYNLFIDKQHLRPFKHTNYTMYSTNHIPKKYILNIIYLSTYDHMILEKYMNEPFFNFPLTILIGRVQILIVSETTLGFLIEKSNISRFLFQGNDQRVVIVFTSCRTMVSLVLVGLIEVFNKIKSFQFIEQNSISKAYNTLRTQNYIKFLRKLTENVFVSGYDFWNLLVLL